MHEAAAALYEVEGVGGEEVRERENVRKPAGWNKDGVGPGRRSRAVGGKKFLSPIPSSAFHPLPPPPPLRRRSRVVPFSFLYSVSSPPQHLEGDFLMSVRGLKGERNEKGRPDE